jgi:cob(I)alamin adenosyltransferase
MQMLLLYQSYNQRCADMTQRIYTKTGDEGQTGLFGGQRVPKDHPRVGAYGEVDELNAVIGWALTQLDDEEVAARLRMIQSDLFALGAHLATALTDKNNKLSLPELPARRVSEMEAWIDAAEAELPQLKSFILPGGSRGGAALHVARTVCRRAERLVVGLANSERVDPAIIVYLNRLSDFLFDMARLVNYRNGETETKWQP